MPSQDPMGRPWHRTTIIDTNVLLLLVVGRYNLRLIRQFKRTANFGPEDYTLILRQIASSGAMLLTTPHILTEVSNLLGQMSDPARTGCRWTLARMLGDLHERAERASNLAQRRTFAALGITDAAIDDLAGPGVTVVTDDFHLGGFLEGRGVDVWNLRRIRSAL